jgi:hypothetical protein
MKWAGWENLRKHINMSKWNARVRFATAWIDQSTARAIVSASKPRDRLDAGPATVNDRFCL